MNRMVTLVLLILGVAGALTWIVFALLLDEQDSRPHEKLAPSAPPEVTIRVPVGPPVSTIPETSAPEYRPDPRKTGDLKPELLWAMDLQSGEEMIFRFAAPAAPGAIVYLSIEKGSREGVQKVADFCNRTRGEWGGDVIAAARRVGIGLSDAAAAAAFCKAMTSSISDTGARGR